MRETLSEDLCFIALNGLGNGKDVRLCELDAGLWTSESGCSGARGRSLNCCTLKCPFAFIEKKDIESIKGHIVHQVKSSPRMILLTIDFPMQSN